MNVEIISTGTELFLDKISNSNLAYLSNYLIKTGCLIDFHTTVPDDLALITQVIKTALKRVDLLIITGGLGPTADDITRQAIARAAHRNLLLNRQALQSIRRFFKRLGRTMPSNNEVQAYLPQGAQPLVNRLGTAPGFLLRHPCLIGRSPKRRQTKTIIALPGVPKELQAMFQEAVMPRLRQWTKNLWSYPSAKLLLFGISEAHLQERLERLRLSPDVKLGITIASSGVIALRISVKTIKLREANKLLAETITVVKNEFGLLIFGKDNETLEQVVDKLLRKKKLTLAIAESCSGGLLAHKITNVPGISQFFKEGLICYSNNAKIKRLNIPKRLIKQKGAVSPEVAFLMARNVASPATCRRGKVRHSQKVDIGLGITGIAGPGGGSRAKPVGLIYIALCFRSKTEVRKYRFIGDRQTIKDRTASTALNMLRLKLINGFI